MDKVIRCSNCRTILAFTRDDKGHTEVSLRFFRIRLEGEPLIVCDDCQHTTLLSADLLEEHQPEKLSVL